MYNSTTLRSIAVSNNRARAYFNISLGNKKNKRESGPSAVSPIWKKSRQEFKLNLELNNKHRINSLSTVILELMFQLTWRKSRGNIIPITRIFNYLSFGILINKNPLILIGFAIPIQSLSHMRARIWVINVCKVTRNICINYYRNN